MILEPRLPRRGKPYEIFARVGVGSFGERDGRFGVSVGDDTAAASVSVGHRIGAGDFTFTDDGGTRFDRTDDVVRRRENGDYQHTDVWTVGRVSRGPWTMAMVASVLDREAGAPGLLLRGAMHARARTRRWLVATRAAMDQGPWRLEVDSGALSSRYRLDDPQRELGALGGADNRGVRHQHRARLRWNVSPRLALGLGASYRRARLGIDATDGAGSLARAHRHRLRPAVTLVAEPLPDLALSAVVAWQHHRTRAFSPSAESNVAQNVIAGRAGARYWLIDELALFATSVATGACPRSASSTGWQRRCGATTPWCRSAG